MLAAAPLDSTTPRDFGAMLRAARDFVQQVAQTRPRIGIVLGSGLGAIGDRLERRIPYAEIPGMPVTHVAGHAGNLCLGKLGDAEVACLQGRVHLYEGHDPSAVVFGARLLALLGCRLVLLTNAAGGISSRLAPGDLMMLTDHINLTGRSPLVGPNDDSLGPRFPDMSEVYDRAVREAIRGAAEAQGVELREGVYAGMLGPSYETPAEIRMLRTLGADAVGMSTVLEAIALRHAGVRVAGISCITNLAAGISPHPLSHQEVQAIADRTSATFAALVTTAVERAFREALA